MSLWLLLSFLKLLNCSISFLFQGKKQKTEEGESSSAGSENRDEDDQPAIALRPLNMDDLRQAKNQVSLSLCCILRNLQFFRGSAVYSLVILYTYIHTYGR